MVRMFRVSGCYKSIAVLLFFAASPAALADFFYDRTVFATAAPSLTTQNFDSLVGTPEFPNNYHSGEGTASTTSAGLTVAGVNYLGNSAFGVETYIVAPSVDLGNYSLNGTFALVGGRWTTSITFATATTAFGADLGLSHNATGALTLTITLASGEVKITTLNLASRSQFFGVIESSGITKIEAKSSNLAQFAPYTLIDNVSINSPTTIPEPSSVALASIAMAGLLVASRRRKA